MGYRLSSLIRLYSRQLPFLVLRPRSFAGLVTALISDQDQGLGTGLHARSDLGRPAIAYKPSEANCPTVSLLIGWTLITRITLVCGSTVALPKPGKSIPSTIGVPSIISLARLTIAFPAS